MSYHKCEWEPIERLRFWIPEHVFSFLCLFPRGWMLVQPFRWLLFKKVTHPVSSEPPR
jgi:hypothetical protein